MDISKIRLEDQDYNIKDETARNLIEQNQINIEENTNDINLLKEKLYKKLIRCKDAYHKQYDLAGNNFSISFERLCNQSALQSIQGVAIDTKNGRIICVNGTEIYTISNTGAKTVLFTGEYGHGGDCCILNDYIYISDSASNSIHKVNLLNGQKITYTLNSEIISNPNSEGTLKLGGVAINNNSNEVFIVVHEESSDHNVIPQNSTIRIYKYNLIENTAEKLFETNDLLAYLQGFTMDDDCFYIIGNKPFISDYAGSMLFVIDKISKNIVDVLANNENYEYEGLDYGSFNGIEGLFNAHGNYGIISEIGVLSFYGNCSREYLVSDTNELVKSLTITRGGTLHVFFKKTNLDWQANETYTFSNFLEGFAPVKIGTGNTSLIGIANGANRNEIVLFEYAMSIDEMRFFPTTNISQIKCNFSVPTA